MRLYETHISVADTKTSEVSHRAVTGFPFVYRDPIPDILFLWVDEKGKGMIGW